MFVAEASSSALISFTAKMTSGYFVPDGEDVVPFDFIITNPGGHFNETTYKFTCPLEGLYFFMFSLYSGGMYTVKPWSYVLITVKLWS